MVLPFYNINAYLDFIFSNIYGLNVFNASIVCVIKSSNVQPSISAPRSITSLEHPAANPLLLYFFFTDLSCKS